MSGTDDSPSSGEESAQRQKRQRMRTLDTLAGGIAQNMGDLLRSAKGQLETIREASPEHDITQDALDQALTNLDEVTALVEHLLVLSEEEAEGAEEEIDVMALVQEVLSLVGPSFPTEFTMRTRFDEDCRVVGVSSQLQHLVANLVTSAGARMEGREEEQPTVLDVSVREVDADPTLAEEYLHVEPGTYVHLGVSSTAEERAQREGKALGTTTVVNEDDVDLSSTYEIVSAHGGTMTVRDEPGEGIIYNVFLPSASDASPSPTASPDPAGSASSLRVLVVDDDRTVRALEEMRLSKLGHEVVARSRPQEALTVVREDLEAFDVILLDYHMPNMNGLELAHVLREEGCEASVVLITGLSAQVSEAKARVVGIDHFLRKPVESADLRDLLAQLDQ